VNERISKEIDGGPVTVADLHRINAVVRKGEAVEIRPGPDNTAKIMQVKRKSINRE
jgi:hypothetical protein